MIGEASNWRSRYPTQEESREGRACEQSEGEENDEWRCDPRGASNALSHVLPAQHCIGVRRAGHCVGAVDANKRDRPPYNVLVDTNFLSHTVQRKLPLLESMMDCLYAKCNPIITSCVMAELEKLPASKFRLALRVARDERWQRVECDHKGVYADDCLVDRVSKSRIYIVGTNDRGLKIRLRKIPGVPIMSVARGKYVIERLPNAPDS
jgi:rRNA-processing protein FCF1